MSFGPITLRSNAKLEQTRTIFNTEVKIAWYFYFYCCCCYAGRRRFEW